MKKLKVLVVSNCSFYRRFLKKIIDDTLIAKVEYTASSVFTALERIKYSQFDIIIFHIDTLQSSSIKNIMETIHGIIGKYTKVKVIIIKKENNSSNDSTTASLNCGAVGFIEKTIDKHMDIKKFTNHFKLLFNQILIERNTDRSLNVSIKQHSSNVKRNILIRDKNNNHKHFNKPDIILIASSTGGPLALEKVLKNLDRSINKPILVVQHMPPQFTNSLAQSLKRVCRLEVKEARNGEIINSGIVLVAPGGLHMTVKIENSKKIVSVKTAPYVNGVRPSADVLFKSAAKAYSGKKVLAVILTGMGCDGTEGVRVLKQKCDCYCITQSERSCVVYGMPKSVVENDLSDESIDITDIGNRIRKLIHV